MEAGNAVTIRPGLCDSAVVPLTVPVACAYLFFVGFADYRALAHSENPPATLEETDLLGTWVADYGDFGGDDMLILRADGTFKQIYRNRQAGDYVYETPWQMWSIKRFSDGRVRVVLMGGRNYLAGIRWAELDGLEPTPETVSQKRFFSYDDRFAKESVEMPARLILNVRYLASGDLILAHMWSSSDNAFGGMQMFHRVEAPSPLQTLAP